MDLFATLSEVHVPSQFSEEWIWGRAAPLAARPYFLSSGQSKHQTILLGDYTPSNLVVLSLRH